MSITEYKRSDLKLTKQNAKIEDITIYDIKNIYKGRYGNHEGYYAVVFLDTKKAKVRLNRLGHNEIIDIKDYQSWKDKFNKFD